MLNFKKSLFSRLVLFTATITLPLLGFAEPQDVFFKDESEFVKIDKISVGGLELVEFSLCELVPVSKSTENKLPNSMLSCEKITHVPAESIRDAARCSNGIERWTDKVLGATEIIGGVGVGAFTAVYGLAAANAIGLSGGVLIPVATLAGAGVSATAALILDGTKRVRERGHNEASVAALFDTRVINDVDHVSRVSKDEFIEELKHRIEKPFYSNSCEIHGSREAGAGIKVLVDVGREQLEEIERVRKSANSLK